MRRLGLTLTAAVLATTLAGCGKSPASQAGNEASAPAAPVAPPPTEAEMTARLAALPAPYNAADLANGKAKFALCQSCHTIAPGGPNMTGPNLYGVYGRKTANEAGFNYSAPMKAANFTWDAAHLDPWLAGPMAFMPGTKMTFAGIKDATDRRDVVAYVALEGGYKP